ncbi:ABC transporter ATP-binding protein [Rhizobium sp. KVB221]|uniref:ABC transporter ATP-binding protein n=1 Tax=Rhizobium setariae TaxID=2801340 RepID=A0A936YIR7_9HYPH|nr:ABC transporter ATP-binding protein [Rhizobium setariae]MBL0370975.1 ABC transporter ATP-binding protein [Rhizobium setariae]
MITFENTGKAYRNRKGEISWVLRNINRTFADEVSSGILVPEGQGKTTFINLASGNISPSEGRIFRNGGISWPYTFKGNISNKLTGKQNLRFLTDVYGRNFDEAYEFVQQFSELGRYLDQPMRQYNFEMRSRLSISALFSMGFDRILVDEGMEGGDSAFRRRCVQHLEENRDRVKFLIASSKPEIITKYCQEAGVLNNGKLTFYEDMAEAVSVFNKVNRIFA